MTDLGKIVSKLVSIPGFVISTSQDRLYATISIAGRVKGSLDQRVFGVLTQSGQSTAIRAAMPHWFQSKKLMTGIGCTPDVAITPIC